MEHFKLLDSTQFRRLLSNDLNELSASIGAESDQKWAELLVARGFSGVTGRIAKLLHRFMVLLTG